MEQTVEYNANSALALALHNAMMLDIICAKLLAQSDDPEKELNEIGKTLGTFARFIDEGEKAVYGGVTQRELGMNSLANIKAIMANPKMYRIKIETTEYYDTDGSLKL